jgi:hypothetical protein
MTYGPLKNLQPCAEHHFLAESYGVLLLSDGDIRHNKPALVSVLSFRPGPADKNGRLHPPTFAPFFLRRGCKPFIFREYAVWKQERAGSIQANEKS